MRLIVAMMVLSLLALSGTACSDSDGWKSMEVEASAYTSRVEETKAGNPNLAAWGDILKPGMKAVAVSRDLIPLGLKHKTLVKIEGLKGEYRVLDKMNKRWTKKIDIYFGNDVAAAREWGKRKVKISWKPEKK